MTETELLLEAFQRGHAWNPAYPNLQNLDEARVKKLTLKDRDAKDLILSRQMSDINFDGLVYGEHGRAPSFDGSVGPATVKLAKLERCPLPDFPPPSNARFHYDDPDLQAAVESMQRVGASGSGSWPASGCDPQRPGVHSMRVRINPAGAPQKVKDYMAQALDACVKCSAEMGMAKRYILDADSPAELTKTFDRLGGSVIGWNYFPNPGTCNRITGKLSNSYAPTYQLWANLEEHETGHGYGLNHTRGHIMNPSIVLVWPLTWKGGPSEAKMRDYFGGEPVDPVPGPEPSKHPSFTGSIHTETFSGGIAIRGEPVLTIPANHPAGNYQYIVVPDGTGKYKLAPKPIA